KSEMIFFIFYKIGAFLALALPVGISYRIAGAVARVKYMFSRCEKQEMVENLRQVIPGAGEKKLRRYAKEIFINFAMHLVDFLRFQKVDRVFIDGHIPIPGRHFLDEGLKKGKGVIIVSAHIGSWELGGAVLGVLGYPFNVVALDHKNSRVNDFFVKQRQMKGETVISIHRPGRSCFSCLKEKKILTLVGDKDFTNNGAVIKFFGKDTLLPKGPAVLSLKTGATIIPAATIRVRNDNFKLVFDRPIEYTPCGDFEKDVVNLMRLYITVLECYIRENPTQWYCFRRFWKE
ncbi:MAG: lysophospholipid acyltransferase family protein, partial [Candidatus Omnitrophica bacterium]|nr:lysophospholipid acyltransferase family protein [Candidatus Omnitrophota bacterium]